MAHFPFVHPGILGAEPHTEVRDYTVRVGDAGVEVTDCVFWQPAATPGSKGGADVEYRYTVPHPYIATLTKLPRDGTTGLSLMIMASPIDEEHCRAWMIGTFTDPDVTTDDFRAFNHTIFLQDVPILESQRPRPLPLDPTAEIGQQADRASYAYRRWLTQLGLRYGTTPNQRPAGTPAVAEPVTADVSSLVAGGGR
jgi:phenylpropionate dioxygenase-like ring-hydroxylating dioxygenase large terminal subunit